jgi:hypothetical protein
MYEFFGLLSFDKETQQRNAESAKAKVKPTSADCSALVVINNQVLRWARIEGACP